MTMPLKMSVRSTRAIDQLERNLTNGFTPLMKALASFMESEVRLTFRDSVNPWGGAWAPLKHRAGKPLVDTGNLANSTNSEATSDTAKVGVGAGYGVWHQFGSKDGTLPARPFMPLRWQGGPKADLPAHWRDELHHLISEFLFKV